MSILLKKATILDSASPHHGERKDILIESGVIKKIAKSIKAPKARSIVSENLHVSIGWIDWGVQVCDPGFEYKEDLDSVCEAARKGGYTGIVTLPNTYPAIQSKSEVSYLLNKAKNNTVQIYPLGAISKHCKGKELAEIYDMEESGSFGFTDGLQGVADSGMMMRALQYVKKIESIVVNHPVDHNISQDGQINEGILSTSLGLKGIADISEELMLKRDLALTEYTDSKYHALNISSAQSVSLLEKMKTSNVTSSTPVRNLVYTEDELSDFETNFKVLPPLRTQKDKKALIRGLKKGTIQVISSNHVPVERDKKIVEFSNADFGAIGLQTCFSLLNTHLKATLGLEKIVELLSKNPRNILQISIPKIDKNQPAELTIFDPDLSWVFDHSSNASKSANSPEMGRELEGKVLGIINGKKSFLQ